MFNFRYEIELASEEKLWLFGEDFYKDKNLFWKSHQTKLKELCLKVCLNGFPIVIRDLQFKTELVITSQIQFNYWFKNNQPYECHCNA
ncbi:hypothetical protein [Winogradskyella flava]|uniref:hypothetical protein n=1 Tax=Winogradskyella flava TaxID=1884876 RepID=UPI00249337E7|nr:hypothetical protein [Winogradskyella flava]